MDDSHNQKKRSRRPSLVALPVTEPQKSTTAAYPPVREPPPKEGAVKGRQTVLERTISPVAGAEVGGGMLQAESVPSPILDTTSSAHLYVTTPVVHKPEEVDFNAPTSGIPEAEIGFSPTQPRLLVGSLERGGYSIHHSVEPLASPQAPIYVCVPEPADWLLTIDQCNKTQKGNCKLLKIFLYRFFDRIRSQKMITSLRLRWQTWSLSRNRNLKA